MQVEHAAKPSRVAGPLGAYGKGVFKAYPGRGEEDVKTLLNEKWEPGSRLVRI